MKKSDTAQKNSNKEHMKNRRGPAVSGNRKRTRSIQIGVIAMTVVALLAGAAVIAAIAGRPATVSASSSGNEISMKSESASVSSSQSPSDPGVSASSSIQASSSHASSAVPTPTKAPAYSSDGSVSTKREGWYYSPSGKQGVPANATTAYKALCDRFDGIWQGDTAKKEVYITMDCGYDYNGNTAKILDIAKEKGFKITFFVTGAMFETPALKALVLRMANEGHLVGNHTWIHPSLPTMLNEKGAAAVNEQLDKIEKVYKEVTGQEIAHYMRPPMGEFSEATMKIMKDRGYKTVFWSFAHKDWVTTEQPTEEAAKKSVINGLHNGVVYLLHTVSDTNVKILPWLVDQIRADGYEIGLVNDIK